MNTLIKMAQSLSILGLKNSKNTSEIPFVLFTTRQNKEIYIYNVRNSFLNIVRTIRIQPAMASVITVTHY